MCESTITKVKNKLKWNIMIVLLIWMNALTIKKKIKKKLNSY